MSLHEPLVAICTPVYNGGKFIRDALECVQAQTYRNIVHVVSDNASTDDTPRILEEFQGRRVPLIVSRSPQTVPIMPNWNRVIGLAPTDAKWLRILCADDLMTPDAVEKMVALGEANPSVGLVGCGRLLNGTEDNFDWPPVQSVYPGRKAIRMHFARMGTVYGPHVLVRRDRILDAEKPFDETMFGADTDMCLRVLRSCDFAYCHEILAITREHPATVSATAMVKRRLHFFDWLIMMDRHGPYAFEPDELARLRNLYLRYYRRKMLVWPREVRAEHRTLLEKHGEALDGWSFMDAMGNWVLKRLGLTPGWTGYPF